MLKLEHIKQLDVIYFLERNCWNVNDPEALIVEMTVIEEDDKWLAYANQGHVTLQFELNEQFIAQATSGKKKYLFETRAAARAHYEQELEKGIDAIQNTTKNEILQQFFHEWNGKEIRDGKVVQAMKDKIMTEFGVYVM